MTVLWAKKAYDDDLANRKSNIHGRPFGHY